MLSLLMTFEKGEWDMAGFGTAVKVVCLKCNNTFPVSRNMVDANNKGLQHCYCPFCKRGTDVKVISVIR